MKNLIDLCLQICYILFNKKVATGRQVRAFGSGESEALFPQTDDYRGGKEVGVICSHSSPILGGMGS